MKRIKYEILTGSTTGITYQLPIFLEDSVDEMGIMVGFDGEIEQVEQFCNFTYKTGSGNSIIIYNTLNTNNLKTLIDSVFTVSWGDGSTSGITMTTVYDANLTNVSHTYSTIGYKDIEITVDSPWKVEKLKRSIYIPITGSTFPIDFGTLTFTVPYSNPPITGVTQTYLEDYRTLTGNTNSTSISFLAIGKSRIDEFRLYGANTIYSGITTGHTDAGDYTGYTLDGLFYMDYADGYTHITGSTAGINYIDWFLPSKNELYKVWEEIVDYGLGGFHILFGDAYWSSSEYDAWDTWVLDTFSGAMSNVSKSGTRYVRACRTFTDAVGAYSLRDIGPSGGWIFYIDSGTTYYEIASSDISLDKCVWADVGGLLGATAIGIGVGQSNTNIIIGSPGHTSSAAKDCDDLRVGTSTSDFVHEELYNGMITRNEHLIGFLDEPQIYSDIFIERGKQGVMERNLRLGEIDSTGELDIYGSGFFKVKKQ
jgi:hypothetical protein